MLSEAEKKKRASARTRAWYLKNKERARENQKRAYKKRKLLIKDQRKVNFSKSELEDIRIARQAAGLKPLKEVS